MLFLNRKLSAAECAAHGFANTVVPSAELLPHAQRLAAQLASLPPVAVAEGKKLVRGGREEERLLEVSERESEVLKQRWLAPESMEAVMKFMQRKQ